MIRYCIDKWEKNKNMLQDDIRVNSAWGSCDYFYVVKKIVTIILNDGIEACPNEDERPMWIDRNNRPTWATEKITQIDDGHYQGTLLYLIPRNEDSPAEFDYLMGFIEYGSCSICDTLERIQYEGYDDDDVPDMKNLRQKLTETQVKDYMALCKDFICSIIRPYNNGWRQDPEFDIIEES